MYDVTDIYCFFYYIENDAKYQISETCQKFVSEI